MPHSKELRRILCVEDDADIRAIAEMALEMVGEFDVLICASGGDALDRVSDFAPDLIMLDVMMPGMDGPTTLQCLRANPVTAAIPVIFLTAKVQPSEIQYYQSLGALDVIAKPFDPMRLSDEVRRIFNHA